MASEVLENALPPSPLLIAFLRAYGSYIWLCASLLPGQNIAEIADCCIVLDTPSPLVTGESITVHQVPIDCEASVLDSGSWNSIFESAQLHLVLGAHGEDVLHGIVSSFALIVASPWPAQSTCRIERLKLFSITNRFNCDCVYLLIGSAAPVIGVNDTCGRKDCGHTKNCSSGIQDDCPKLLVTWWRGLRQYGARRQCCMINWHLLDHRGLCVFRVVVVLHLCHQLCCVALNTNVDAVEVMDRSVRHDGPKGKKC
eukprot:6336462-Amphidinium_carterae.1